MAKDQTANRGWRKNAKGKSNPPATLNASAAEKPLPKKRVSPAQFFREVRAEARKITWPSRKETWITSVLVFVMIMITTGFFFLVDAITGNLVGYIIKIGT
jgi:preprotein translocase subunit SecE